MSRPAGVGERRPITRQRSSWDPIEWSDLGLEALGARIVGAWIRRTGDGILKALVTVNPPGPEEGWHLSISFSDHRGRLSRYPRWDEIADARECFCPDDVTMALLLPPSADYVSLHDTTFQLHEVTRGMADALAAPRPGAGSRPGGGEPI